MPGRSRQPHPLPLLVLLIKQGIGKLRAVEAKLPTAYSEIDLYRGMKGVSVPEQFLETGATGPELI